MALHMTLSQTFISQQIRPESSCDLTWMPILVWLFTIVSQSKSYIKEMIKQTNAITLMRS